MSRSTPHKKPSTSKSKSAPTPVKKSAPAAKAKSTSKPAAKPTKPAAAKHEPKPAAKSAKPLAKHAKPIAKPAPKATAKPAPKAITKPAPKAVAKPAKPAPVKAKPASKAVPAPKGKPAKAPVKSHVTITLKGHAPAALAKAVTAKTATAKASSAKVHEAKRPAAPVPVDTKKKIKEAINRAGGKKQPVVEPKATHTHPSKQGHKQHPRIFFSMEDVRAALANRGSHATAHKPEPVAKPAREATRHAPAKAQAEALPTIKPRQLGAASIEDILGFVPAKAKDVSVDSHHRSKVPSQWLPYFDTLIGMRDRISGSLEQRSKDTLKRNTREDSGDLSAYGQNSSDAGIDTFDQEFALSLVSSEQEQLAEVKQALNRIKKGTYGICEATGQPIGAERLKAVPYTRFSKEGQQLQETMRRRSAYGTSMNAIEGGEGEEIGEGSSED